MASSSLTPGWTHIFEYFFTSLFAQSREKEARSRDYALLSFWMNSSVLYSAQYHRQHCTLHSFEQFGALYMHNHDDKYPARPGFEPGTCRLQAPVDTNEHTTCKEIIQQTSYIPSLKQHWENAWCLLGIHVHVFIANTDLPQIKSRLEGATIRSLAEGGTEQFLK